MSKINKQYLKLLGPCQNQWKNYLSKHEGFSGTISEFLELDGIPWNDKKWVLFRLNSLLPEKVMREFALIVACRTVEKSTCQEVKDYFDLVLHLYVSESTELLDDEEYRAAHRAAYWAAYRASYWAAYWAADRAAYWAADWAADRAADRAAYWAADWAADRAAEENIQKDILINLIDEYGV